MLLLLIIVVFVGELTVEGATAVFGHVDNETIHFRKSLIARVTMIVIFAFQFAKWSTAMQFGTVEGAR